MKMGPPHFPARRPLRDNPRLILAGMILLLAALGGIISLANRSAGLSPDFLTEFVLYGLWAADLTILLVLTFVLARNVIKLIVERRRALPFARFRGKLVAVLLGMTLIPAVLVLLVGSGLIRNSVERWFNAPVEEVLTAADLIASDYYGERQARVTSDAERMSRALAASSFDQADMSAVRERVYPEVAQGRVKMVEVFRIDPGQVPTAVPYLDVAAPDMPHGHARTIAARMASRAAAGQPETPTPETLASGGELIRATALVRRSGTNQPVAVVVATDLLTGELARRARRISNAYEDYSRLRVFGPPLAGVYLSLFLMMTLMILVGATWMGLYLAKRITEPVQRLATAAREIEAGHLDYRVDRGTVSDDEFGSLVEAFNSMASEVGKSRRRLERSTTDLERKHIEVEGRRRYIETILERIATGVVSIDASGRISTVNSAAKRLLDLNGSALGQPATDVFGREDLQPFGALLRAAANGKTEPSAQEIALTRDDRELQLAAIATALPGSEGNDGMVLVLDDVTPLIRAQKVAAWREVARRLAHEIKNPLTPIQLSAERMRRHFSGAPVATQALVEECASTIVGEVDSLKALVDEFSQFARMPAPRAAPTDLHALLNEALALYEGLLGDIRFDRRYAERLPKVRVDSEQIRRVIINLVDNAIEAMNRSGVISIETQHDASASLVRLFVSDNGPGIPMAEREKLFMPYYSTKRRGSGLGLAIVRRIVAEHGGTIEAGDNQPRGTRFTIELPC
jgi:two-component system nitrogen regulation sensor histidine kinase NtrY